MKRYTNFINEKNNQSNKYIDLIISYLYKNTNYDYSKYYSEWKLKKAGISESLKGHLYLLTNPITDETKAIRINLMNNSIYSIDMWETFHFESNGDKWYEKPNWEMSHTSDSIVSILDDIVAFVEGEFIDNNLLEKQHLSDINKSPDEEVEPDKDIDDDDDFVLDLFEAITTYTEQVILNPNSNAFVISGLPGLGKTYDVEQALKNHNITYKRAAGGMTTKGLYETLFRYRNGFLLLDDIDSVLKKEESILILKAVLDTAKTRTVSRYVDGYYDPDGMTDADMDAIYKEKKKLPEEFDFTGKIIFITNVDGDDLDEAIISRSIHLDLKPEMEKVIERIRTIMPGLIPEIPMNIKEDTLDYMVGLITEYEEKFPLNIRTFYHSLNMRYSNEVKVKVNGEEIMKWKGMIKLYLVKNRKRITE